MILAESTRASRTCRELRGSRKRQTPLFSSRSVGMTSRRRLPKFNVTLRARYAVASSKIFSDREKKKKKLDRTRGVWKKCVRRLAPRRHLFFSLSPWLVECFSRAGDFDRTTRPFGMKTFSRNRVKNHEKIALRRACCRYRNYSNDHFRRIPADPHVEEF